MVQVWAEGKVAAVAAEAWGAGWAEEWGAGKVEDRAEEAQARDAAKVWVLRTTAVNLPDVSKNHLKWWAAIRQ